MRKHEPERPHRQYKEFTTEGAEVMEDKHSVCGLCALRGHILLFAALLSGWPSLRLGFER